MIDPGDGLIAALELFDEPAFLSDPESRGVIFANEAAEHLFGKREGLCWHGVGYQAACSCCVEAIEAFAKTGLPGRRRLWHYRDPATGIYYQVRERFVACKDGFASLAILREESDCEETSRAHRQYISDLERLLQISRELTATTNLAALSRRIIELARTMLDLEFSTLMVLSPDGTSLTVQDTLGFSSAMVGTSAPVEGQVLFAVAVREKRPVNVSDFSRESRFGHPELFSEYKIASAICTPMVIQNEVFGVLIGHSRQTRQFTPEEIALYQTLGNQAAVALRHARQMLALEISEQKFKDIFDHVGDAIFITDTGGRLLTVNRVACEQLGYEREELLALTLDKLEAPDTMVPARMRREILLAEGRLHSEAILIRRDGSPLTTELNCRVIEFEDRRAILCSARDIRVRKKAEQALAAEKERLRVTLRSIADGVITTATDGRVLLINRAAEVLTGWRQEETGGRPLTEIFRIINEKSRKVCENPVEKVLKTGEVVGLANHTVLVTRSGRERLLEESGAPIKNNDGQVIGVVLVFRDITHKKRNEEAMLRMEKLEAVGVLAGGIAHDFNNLLTSILGNINLARTWNHFREEEDSPLLDAEKAALQARDLTQQLLTFARGGTPVRRSAAIQDLVQQSCIFGTRGSAVRCVYDLALDLWPVEIDRGQINQVFNNLVINATQAMPRGGSVTIRGLNVVLAAHDLPPLPAGRYVRIMVEDEGTGIPPEHLGSIFEPYFTTKQKGSGLGLATCFSIINNHDGHIGVESRLGQGSIFSVYLPASEKEVATAEPAERAVIKGEGRILIMDDEEAVCKVVTRMLLRLGYQSDFARDGREAIDRYRQAKEAGQEFAVVLMDLTVPGGMGGREAVAGILAYDAAARVIVSSGYSTDPVMSDYRRHGFVEVITKPYEMEELGRVLHRVLGG